MHTTLNLHETLYDRVHEGNTKIWFINGVDNVNWPPYIDWKAYVSSVSPSSEQIANARNVSFSISVRWSIYIINSVDKPNFRVSLPHRCSTTVSLETNPLYMKGRSLCIQHWIYMRHFMTGYMYLLWTASRTAGLVMVTAGKKIVWEAVKIHFLFYYFLVGWDWQSHLFQPSKKRWPLAIYSLTIFGHRLVNVVMF